MCELFVSCSCREFDNWSCWESVSCSVCCEVANCRGACWEGFSWRWGNEFDRRCCWGIIISWPENWSCCCCGLENCCWCIPGTCNCCCCALGCCCAFEVSRGECNCWGFGCCCCGCCINEAPTCWWCTPRPESRRGWCCGLVWTLLLSGTCSCWCCSGVGSLLKKRNEGLSTREGIAGAATLGMTGWGWVWEVKSSWSPSLKHNFNYNLCKGGREEVMNWFFYEESYLQIDFKDFQKAGKMPCLCHRTHQRSLSPSVWMVVICMPVCQSVRTLSDYHSSEHLVCTIHSSMYSTSKQEKLCNTWQALAVGLQFFY